MRSTLDDIFGKEIRAALGAFVIGVVGGCATSSIISYCIDSRAANNSRKLQEARVEYLSALQHHKASKLRNISISELSAHVERYLNSTVEISGTPTRIRSDHFELADGKSSVVVYVPEIDPWVATRTSSLGRLVQNEHAVRERKAFDLIQDAKEDGTPIRILADYREGRHLLALTIDKTPDPGVKFGPTRSEMGEFTLKINRQEYLDRIHANLRF